MIHGLPAIAFLKRWELVLLRSAYEVNQVAVWFDLTWVLGYQVLENFVLAGCPVGKLQLLHVVGFAFIAKALAGFRAPLGSRPRGPAGACGPARSGRAPAPDLAAHAPAARAAE